MRLSRYAAILVTTLVTVAGTIQPVAAVVRDRPASSASFNGPVLAVASYGSVIFVAGDFSRATDSRGTFVRSNLAAVSATTGRLLQWHPAANGPVKAVAAYRGRVFVGGAFTRVNGHVKPRIAKLSARTGGVDSRFRGATSDEVRAIAVTSTRIFIGGTFTRSLGYARRHLASYNRLSNQITSWHPRTDGAVRVLRTGHRLVWAGGAFESINGHGYAARVAAVNPVTGGVSSTFRMTQPYSVRDLRVTPSRVYIVTAGLGGHVFARRLSGAPIWQRAFDGDVNSVATLDGSIYVGGHFVDLCAGTSVQPGNGDCAVTSAHRPRLAAFNGSGVATSWTPDGDSSLGVLTLAPSAATHSLVAGGDFTAFKNGSVRQPRFALFRR